MDSFTLSSQAGEGRTPQGTVETIERQISVACLGVKEAVEKIQTETGVKDKTANFWIEQLLDKARKAQDDQLFNRAIRDPRLNDAKTKGATREDIKQAIKLNIQKELLDWVVRQPAGRFALLDQDSREFEFESKVPASDNSTSTFQHSHL